jgi:hypothetical protein
MRLEEAFAPQSPLFSSPWRLEGSPLCRGAPMFHFRYASVRYSGLSSTLALQVSSAELIEFFLFLDFYLSYSHFLGVPLNVRFMSYCGARACAA